LTNRVQDMLRDVVPADHPHRRAAYDLLVLLTATENDGAGLG
jgi:hypothetical protein